MIRLPLMLALLIWPFAVHADWHDQDRFPQLGDVVNVEADDVLNVRLEPDHTSEVIGSLAPNARSIEIVGTDESGKWGLINSGEGSGWVRLSFLAISDQPRWHEFATPMTCFGTEPFWDFAINAGATEAVYTDYDEKDHPFPIDWTSDIAARLPGIIGMGSNDPEMGFSAIIENQMCHDGMSDRENALRIRLFIHEDGSSYGLDGCCGLTP